MFLELGDLGGQGADAGSAAPLGGCGEDGQFLPIAGERGTEAVQIHGSRSGGIASARRFLVPLGVADGFHDTVQEFPAPLFLGGERGE